MTINTTPGPYGATVLADSICEETNVRLTTICATFPRFILPEQNTHRVMSKNTASSRAIPVKKSINRVKDYPFFPEVFGKNQPGMVAEQNLSEESNLKAKEAWQKLLEAALECAETLDGLQVHKQYANRVLELFSWTTQIITSTEWENYFNLRVENDAQPEMQKTAKAIKEVYSKSTPNKLMRGDWHLPLINDSDYEEYGNNFEILRRLSSARCARASYLTHDGQRCPEKDISLHDILLKDCHMSPFEHPAELGYVSENYLKSYLDSDFKKYLIPNEENEPTFVGNFRAPWIQYRKMIKGESIKKINV